MSPTEVELEKRIKGIIADPADPRQAQAKDLVSRLTLVNQWLNGQPMSHPGRAKASEDARALEKQLYDLAFPTIDPSAAANLAQTQPESSFPWAWAAAGAALLLGGWWMTRSRSKSMV